MLLRPNGEIRGKRKVMEKKEHPPLWTSATSSAVVAVMILRAQSVSNRIWMTRDSVTLELP